MSDELDDARTYEQLRQREPDEDATTLADLADEPGGAQ